MRTVIVLCLSAVILNACKTTPDENTTDELVTLKPLTSTELLTDFSSYIDTIEIIFLETRAESFIVNVTKVLITATNDICLLTNGKVLLFDSQGKFKFQVGHIGKGPGEYVRVVDICISDNEANLLAQDSYNDILKYSLLDGRFFEEIKPEWEGKLSTFDGICPSNDGGFFLFSSNPLEIEDFTSDFYCLGKFNRDGKLLEESFIRKDFNVPKSRFTRSFNNGAFMRPLEGENTFYKIFEGKVMPHLKIDFEKKTIPLKFIFSFPDDPLLHFSDFIRSPYYKLTMDLLETKTHFYFWCGGPGGKAHEFLYTKGNSSGIHWTSFDDMIPFNLIAADSEYFYAVYNTAEENSFDGNYEKNPLKIYLENNYSFEEYDINSNPVLVKFKFRSFK